jgi:hypothetical protein
MYSVHDPLARGLPHSDIHGSKPARGSPWLFAACHVLHRLLMPRHPPNALIVLTPHTHRNHPRKTFRAKTPKTLSCAFSGGENAVPNTQHFSQTFLSANPAALTLSCPGSLPADQRVRPTQLRHAQKRTNLFTLTKNQHLPNRHPRGCGRNTNPGSCNDIPNALDTRHGQRPDLGGGRRVRTDDPLLAKQVLSQLSYAPIRTTTQIARNTRNTSHGASPPRSWWAREDLNLRPHAYQACALTN